MTTTPEIPKRPDDEKVGTDFIGMIDPVASSGPYEKHRVERPVEGSQA